MPVRINSNWRLASLPTSSVMRSRSRATICEALATESLDKPVALAGRSTLPGASAQTRLLVNGTQDTASIQRIALRNNHRSWEYRAGTGRVWQVCPVHMPLGNYHSTASRIRRATASNAGSGLVSTISQTRFIASVTASG